MLDRQPPDGALALGAGEREDVRVVEPRGVLGARRLHTAGVGREDVVERLRRHAGGEDELQEQRVPQLERLERFGEPRGERCVAGIGERVDLPVGLTVAGDRLDLHEPVALEGMQLAVDLALRRGPEGAHRAVEALLQQVAGGRLDLEEPEDGAAQRH